MDIHPFSNRLSHRKQNHHDLNGPKIFSTPFFLIHLLFLHYNHFLVSYFLMLLVITDHTIITTVLKNLMNVCHHARKFFIERWKLWIVLFSSFHHHYFVVLALKMENEEEFLMNYKIKEFAMIFNTFKLFCGFCRFLTICGLLVEVFNMWSEEVKIFEWWDFGMLWSMSLICIAEFF